MRDLLNDYFVGGVSRRDFLGRLAAAGFTTAAAARIAEAADAGEAAAAEGARSVTGTGGDLLVEQMQAAGSRFVFTNPGSMEVGSSTR